MVDLIEQYWEGNVMFDEEMAQFGHSSETNFL
jgi:hypothetical protein